jgi:mono/diheme cytochrome c family protein
MRARTMYGGLVVAGLAVVITAQAWAFPQFARENKAACASCHVNPAGGPDLSEAGKAFKAEKKAPAAVAGADYVGSKKCMMCHPKQSKAWTASKHAQALALLKTATAEQVAAMSKTTGVEVKGKASETDGCVTCHVTGFKLAGGYPAADSLKNVALSAVACEACHGPGSKHVAAPMADKKKMINGAVTANMCMQCHTSAISPKFNFEEMKKLVHPVPAAPKTTG